MSESANAEKMPERRRAHRRAVKIESHLVHSSGTKIPNSITDLSEEGCAIRLPGDVILSDTDFYCIKIGTFETQASKAVWSDTHKAGLKFVAPFAPYVIDHIVRHQ